jgi:hypothetical protein
LGCHLFIILDVAATLYIVIGNNNHQQLIFSCQVDGKKIDLPVNQKNRGKETLLFFTMSDKHKTVTEVSNELTERRGGRGLQPEK